MKRNKVLKEGNILSAYEEQFIFMDDESLIDSIEIADDFLKQVAIESLIEADEQITELPQENQNEFKEQAEIVKSYKSPGLDDDFMGEYSPPLEGLEANSYVDPNQIYDSYNKSLFKAIELGDEDMMLFALKQGANIHAINDEGKTCLDIAIENKSQNFIDLIDDFLNNKSKL